MKVEDEGRRESVLHGARTENPGEAQAQEGRGARASLTVSSDATALATEIKALKVADARPDWETRGCAPGNTKRASNRENPARLRREGQTPEG